MHIICKSLLRIKAIISDFDGTLCPTLSINSYNNESNNAIPPDLKDILNDISNSIPICIISFFTNVKLGLPYFSYYVNMV
jgi:trehalose-6-phosphatase